MVYYIRNELELYKLIIFVHINIINVTFTPSKDYRKYPNYLEQVF